MPVEKGYEMYSTIERDKSFLNKFHPKYYMVLDKIFISLLTAKKKPINSTSNYLISV